MSYNNIHNSASCLIHDSISAIENLSHQILDIASEKSIPILNEVLHTNLDTNVYTYPHYQTKTINKTILIYIEIPGVKKEDCQLIYKRGVLEFLGGSSHREAFSFLKSKKYSRQIKIPVTVERDDVSAIYENGVIYLTINIPNVTDEDIPVSDNNNNDNDGISKSI
jgi:HSP20 family molecular chaperone IbpA